MVAPRTLLPWSSPICSFPRRRSRSTRWRSDVRHRHTIRRRDGDHHHAPTKKSSPEPQLLRLTIDLDQLSRRASASLQSLHSSSESQLRRFLSTGGDAFQDLRTLVAVDPSNGRRVVLSCRRTTLQFISSLFLFGLLVVVALRALLRPRRGPANNVVVRRDRSLGGKEVVVARPIMNGTNSSGTRSNNLLSFARPQSPRIRASEKLPKWWPVMVAARPDWLSDEEQRRREANGLIRAMMDDRTSGRDISADDIIRLRRICRAGRTRVSIDTANTRDAVYRAAVDLILNACGDAPPHSASVQVADEDPRQFVAGFAENIGVESVRAARIVSAAVAARTRSRFLQAWALEMRGERAQAAAEISRLCVVLRVFPPEESSPEMEMVARGLEKQLKLEQREFLLSIFVGVCGGEGERCAAEALGVMSNASIANTTVNGKEIIQ